MSHSVFRDLDENETSGNGSRGDVADNNLIVFIHKDGGVQVDPNALQDLIVNANTDTKSTVSVIRIGSPTPSMETDEDESSTKQSDGDDNSQSEDDESKNSAESSEESDQDDADSTDKSQKLKKKKKKNKVPGYGLTVEEFYNPEQAVKFATEIMNIAGITNPKQLKADYEHLRYIIQNDHCYTPYTYADSLSENKKSEDLSEGTKRDAKSKQKTSSTPASSSTAKKPGRPPLSKSTPSNGLDRDASNSARNRSVDDANSSNENTADQNDSDEEEAESETDYSNFTASDTDNDRDSDLDFSVNDCHSRRAKKFKKRKIQAKKLANKKRRRSTIDFTGSDDGTTPKGKKVAKLPKKALNTSAKSTTAASPAVSSTSKSPAATSTPRLTKVTYVKESTQTISHDNPSKAPAIQKATSTTTSQSTPSSSTSLSSVDNKPKSIIVVKQREKKVQSENVVSDMSSLFTPDVIKKKNPTENTVSAYKHPIVVVNANRIPLSTPTIRVDSVSKSLTPIIVHSIAPQTTTPRITTTTTTRVIRMPAMTYCKMVKPAVTKLASESDKQLDLIDSLVQEELSKSEADATSSSSASSQLIVPAAIPNIVKMLETSEASPSIEKTDLVQTSSTSNTMPITYSTTQSTHDAQMLPDELLDSIVNSDYMTDDLMQHVAKLVEDKNLQEVIDQQMQDVNSISSCTATPPPPPPHSQIQAISVVPKPIIVHSTASTPAKLPEEQKEIVNIAKTSATGVALAAMANKKGITVRRSDGRIIILPPIEAPTTRGAKRRAEIIPGQETLQKSETIKTIEPTDSSFEQKSAPNTPTTEPIKSPLNSATKQAKPIVARERRASVAVKRASTDTKPRRSMSISNPPPTPTGITAVGGEDDDDDDEEDGSDGSYNSEDDPHRLWCICRTPHNNRFMICCDKCEEWFHGKCVGITRQMGREMEQRQSEYICPNCIKKQQPSIKNIFPRKVVVENSPKIKEAGSSIVTQSSTDSPVPNCIVCSVKPSRVHSVYCSDDCIRKHATKTVSASSASESEASSAPITPSLESPTDGEKKTTQTKIISQLFKDKANHVVVIEKTTGKIFSGKSAPTYDKLQQWLTEHPTFEVLKPGTPQATAFKAKQQQLKSLAKNMSEKELFAVSQPAKVQTKLRFEADKMVYVSPTTQKQVITTTLKRPISATSSSSPVNLKSPANKLEPITKTPKLSSTSAQKPTSAPLKKRTSSTPEAKTPTSSKSDSSNSKSNERDRLRVNARKTLVEQLIIRTKEITDPNAPRLTEAEITEFIRAAELEMFEMFGGDTNMKYKSKYRSLMYNIKDRKNLTLFEKISSKMIEPKQLVHMSTEELASQELAKWRENENKHQLEMITKSELDMLACGNTYVLKTHKGEEVIQESSERIILDPSIPDLVSVLNNTAVSSSDATTTTKDSRVDKYLSSDGNKPSLSSSSKKDAERSHEKKDRHESRSSGSSSKHKRKRSRERHSSHSGHSHSHKDKSHDKDKKERSSGSENRKDKKDQKSSGSSSSSGSNRSKHHSEKDRKRESTSKPHSNPPKIAKTDENSIIDKILKAQSTIDSILHPEEFKKNEPTTIANVSSASTIIEGGTSTLTRQSSATNESDQEPTSTVTIPSPPEVTTESHSTTPPPPPPPPVERSIAPIVWSGAISMVDVATFQVSLSPLSGSTAMIDFPKEFDVVGRINPDTVWEYLDKIRISKDIVLLKFSPRSSSDDDETAYSTFISYLDTRKRLGVIKIPSKMVKDFYIMPLTSHKSLPSILKSTTGFDLGADRPDLLLGIIVRNRMSQTGHLPTPPKHRQPIPFIGHKPSATVPTKDAHYTPPSSPNMNIQVQAISKQVIKSTFSSNLDDDDDEPYSPGGSDEDDLSLNTIPTSYLSSTSANPIPDYSKPIVGGGGGSALSSFDKQQLDELNRQIEAEKKQIAMHLQTVDIDEPYSPTSSVSPPINTNLSDVVSNISIPANLADILKNVASFQSTTTSMSMSQYSASLMDTSDNEYVPASISYAPASSQLAQSVATSSQPSRLAQLTDEELLRLVPDEID